MLKAVNIGMVIGRKQSGQSNRQISRELGYDRAKISEIWSRYCGQVSRLGEEGADIKAIQAEMTEDPKYNGAGRGRWRYTPAAEARLREILEAEEEKKRRLGARHKQGPKDIGGPQGRFSRSEKS